MKEEILDDLRRCQVALQKAIDHIEYHSVSKLDLLFAMQELNLSDENQAAIELLHRKFFRDTEDKEREPEGDEPER